MSTISLTNTNSNIISSIEEELRNYDGQRVFFRSERFPDLGILVEGKIGEHAPPYTIQVLARHWDRGYAWAHQDELKQYFHPLIDLGATYEITSITRRDYLGIDLKTGYLNPRRREVTLSKVAEVIYSIFYELIEIPTTESLIVSEYEPATHPSIPSNLWRN